MPVMLIESANFVHLWWKCFVETTVRLKAYEKHHAAIFWTSGGIRRAFKIQDAAFSHMGFTQWK